MKAHNMLDKRMFDQQELRTAFGFLPTGVTVVTLRDENNVPTGVTIGSFTSLSMSPALCLFTLGKKQASARLCKVGTSFVVNVLSNAQADIAWQFAKPLKDKCAGVDLCDTIVDVPRLQDCVAYFACIVETIYDGGDHIIIIGKILDFANDEGESLVFYRGHMHKPLLI
jgi:3-hydroxy-9,10-secoandrosta-1,3,5(10)-triene-9,17-dione monooxygenase reductase component|tara:strand:+ start:308 stop:814 length:507 start_codon:yes stop_codon:yes gene_type:complete